MASEKEITDPLRSLFNESNDPFRFYPSFNDGWNGFNFKSDVDISREFLTGLLIDEGLTLTMFVRYNLEETKRSFE